MKTIQEILLEMRESRDMKQVAIAEMLGISQQQYSRYETGESDIPPRVISMLADYYGVSTDYLLGRKEWTHGVPGMDRKVTAEQTAGDVLNAIMELSAAGRAAVVEYITLQRMKESCAQKKEKDGTAT